MTRAELEAIGWTDAKLDALYAEHVKKLAPGARLSRNAGGAADAPAIQKIRRERYDAVCAKLYG